MSEDKSTTVEEVSAAPTSIPLLSPANGIPPVVDTDQKFAIPSDKADTSTLKVTVQTSSTDTTRAVYTLAGGYNNVSSETRAYFIQEGSSNNYEIYLLKSS